MELAQIEIGHYATPVDEKTPFGVNKVERYGWVMKDKPGTLQQIPKNFLCINEAYQREANKQKVLEIASQWSWLACGTITVAQRKGRLWVIDGQHRVLAARKRSDIYELPCLEFELDDVRDEAMGFYRANAGRKPVTALAKHKALLVAGDATANQVADALNAAGLSLKKRAKSAGEIKAVSLLYARANESLPLLHSVLKLCADLCQADGVFVHERLLDGIWYIAKNYEHGLKDARLVARLKSVGARSLITAAQRAAAYYTKGGAAVWANGMLTEINRGLHKRFVLRGGEEA